MRKTKEPVEFSFNHKDFSNFIKDIYYEYETETAVMFNREKDNKILWIPKIAIRGGYTKDKNIAQNITLNFVPKNLGWIERQKRVLYSVI